VEDVQALLRRALADRHAPEARALFSRLAHYIHGRVQATWTHACRDLVDAAECDEVVGEVLEELIAGALARFRGQSTGELLSYVRRIADRCLLHRARRRLRERSALSGPSVREIAAWQVTVAAPGADLPESVDNPLHERDQSWLRELFASGTMAEHARRTSVSRAAVTLRVQRIRARIDALAPAQRDAAEAWLEQAAREAVAARGV
jgi:hypothetical protein